MDERERQHLEDRLRAAGIDAPGVRFRDGGDIGPPPSRNVPDEREIVHAGPSRVTSVRFGDLAPLTGRCATCRWAEPGQRISMGGGSERRTLQCRRIGSRDQSDTRDLLAYADGEENEHGVLAVSPDFGCVMYEVNV